MYIYIYLFIYSFRDVLCYTVSENSNLVKYLSEVNKVEETKVGHESRKDTTGGHARGNTEGKKERQLWK